MKGITYMCRSEYFHVCSCTVLSFCDSHSSIPITAHTFSLRTPHEQGTIGGHRLNQHLLLSTLQSCARLFFMIVDVQYLFEIAF